MSHRVVYLDQNKWIEIARAVHYADKYPQHRRILEAIVPRVKSGELVFPLTQANLYETFKVADPDRRARLAWVQATLSEGLVIRGQRRRLTEELSDVLRKTYNLPAAPSKIPDWFLSNLFWEATLETDDPRLPHKPSNKVIDLVRKQPQRAMFMYLTDVGDTRAIAVSQFSAGVEELRNRVQARRDRDKNETIDFRRRLYSALLLVGELDLLNSLALELGVPFQEDLESIGENIKRLVDETPLFYIERELALKLESEPGSLRENDFRDLQTFSAVLPYADVVIAEKPFVNRARQARLDKKYDTQLLTDLTELPSVLVSEYIP